MRRCSANALVLALCAGLLLACSSSKEEVSGQSPPVVRSAPVGPGTTVYRSRVPNSLSDHRDEVLWRRRAMRALEELEESQRRERLAY